MTPRAYVIAEIDVHDPATYEEYKTGVAPLIAQYGGRYLVRGGDIETIDGHPPYGRVVVLEFPSMTDAKAFLQSEEYRPVAEIRYRSATSRLILAEGLTP